MSISPDEIIIPLPNTVHITQPFVYLVYWWVGIFAFSFLLKVFNKGPNIKNGIIAGLSILIMYVACVLIYTYEPLGLQEYLVPLPFIEFHEDSLSLVLFEIVEGGKINIPKFCGQIASMFVLAFLVNQIYAFKPGNLKSPGWLVFRLFSTLFCIGVHYAVYRVLQKVIGMIPEDSLIETALPYFPIGFLIFLLFTFVLGWLKNLMKYFFKQVNPTFEGLSGFFFVNRFGVIVTRAIYTTIVLTVFAYGLQKQWETLYQIATIPISAMGIPTGMITLGALFILWLIVGFML